MLLKPTEISGAFVVVPDLNKDERGTFSRTFCSQEFERLGLESKLDQCAISHNPKKGTLRGLHYQLAPFQETKLVRCARGAIYDVVLDLRQDSPSFRKWFALELNDKSEEMLYIPVGCAHGFISMKDDTEVVYQVFGIYNPEYARGIRWNDPAFAITWPVEPTVMSHKDRECPLYLAKEHA